MHIPDGFLDVKTYSVLYGVSTVAVAWAVRRLNKSLDEKQVPLLGVVAAFIFAAQMLNFPVAGGTSGHFMGGVLAGALLGPASGILVMTTVLVVQCLVFQDGGLTALGANVFNIGVVCAAGGYFIFAVLKKFLGLLTAVFISGWVSVVLAASLCAVELAVSNTIPLKAAMLAMVSVHAIIGIGEALITVAVFGFISKVRPDILELKKG